MYTRQIEDWAVRHRLSEQAYRELLHIVLPPAPDVSDNPERHETAIQTGIRLDASKQNNMLLRNNNGVAIAEDGRHVRYGLGNDSKKLNENWKSSDLIGITQVRASYVGQIFGVFTAVEAKAGSWRWTGKGREVAQSNFLRTVNCLGGIGLFANSLEYYRGVINGKTCLLYTSPSPRD